MSKRVIAEIVGVVVLVLLGGLALSYYISAREADARAETQKQNSNATIADQQKVIEAKDKQIADRKDARDQEIADLQREFAKVKTQKQAVQYIEAKRPALKIETLPDSPSHVAVDAKQLAGEVNKCDEQAISHRACEENIFDMGTQLDAARAQHLEAEKKAEAWEKAAKGGSKFKRFVQAAKWAAIFGAVGYAAGRAAH